MPNHRWIDDNGDGCANAIEMLWHVLKASHWKPYHSRYINQATDDSFKRKICLCNGSTPNHFFQNWCKFYRRRWSETVNKWAHPKPSNEMSWVQRKFSLLDLKMQLNDVLNQNNWWECEWDEGTSLSVKNAWRNKMCRRTGTCKWLAQRIYWQKQSEWRRINGRLRH